MATGFACIHAKTEQRDKGDFTRETDLFRAHSFLHDKYSFERDSCCFFGNGWQWLGYEKTIHGQNERVGDAEIFR